MDFRIDVRLTPDLEALLLARGIPNEIRGEVTSDLEYILALEYGHSGQAPTGWIRRNREAYARLLRGEILHALELMPDDPVKAIYAGVTMGVLGITRQVVDGSPGDGDAPHGTPVDTGRAKGSWVSRLPDGKRFRQAPAVSAAQQAAIHRARRRARPEAP